jgi:ribosomal-protein-alanine N-acetyltransferase
MRLETPRLFLRRFEDADFDEVHAYAQDPEVTRYQSWGPNDEAATRAFLERSQDLFQPPDADDLEFAIVERKSGSVIGGCGIHSRRRPYREYEMGWTLARSCWRQGFGSEAATAVIDYAFDAINAHRVFAQIDTENDASIALAEKLGFVREGHQRLDTLIRGEWRDTLIYARLSLSD